MNVLTLTVTLGILAIMLVGALFSSYEVFIMGLVGLAVVAFLRVLHEVTKDE